MLFALPPFYHSASRINIGEDRGTGSGEPKLDGRSGQAFDSATATVLDSQIHRIVGWPHQKRFILPTAILMLCSSNVPILSLGVFAIPIEMSCQIA